jgi:hypothetical protein
MHKENRFTTKGKNQLCQLEDYHYQHYVQVDFSKRLNQLRETQLKRVDLLLHHLKHQVLLKYERVVEATKATKQLSLPEKVLQQETLCILGIGSGAVAAGASFAALTAKSRRSWRISTHHSTCSRIFTTRSGCHCLCS